MGVFDGRILGHLVLPHMVGQFMTGSDSALQRLWVQLADPARREQRDLDPLRVEHVKDAPDADTPAELSLGTLAPGLVQQAA